MGKTEWPNISQLLVLIGGFVSLLYTFYYMQQLSYSVGVYTGISRTLAAYNVTNSTAPTVLAASISQSTTLNLALHLTYVLLPFAVLMLAIGIIWLFSTAYSRLSASILMMSSVIYGIFVAVLELDFRFSGALLTFPIAYAAVLLVFAGSAYPLWKTYYRAKFTKRSPPPVTINPETPYTNMRLISNRIMRRLNGNIRILDMHFDTNSLDNLMQLAGKHTQQYNRILVLTSSMRLGTDFGKSYRDFKSEMSNKKVLFELRILSQEEAAKQHERLLMDENIAYKIPPLNIINRKNEHIVGINHDAAMRTFDNLWSKATKYENMR